MEGHLVFLRRLKIHFLFLAGNFLISLTFFSSSLAIANTQVGFGAVDITPYSMETRPLGKNDPYFKKGSKYWDTGIDGKFDFEEAGAFGPDGQPGVAGVDDDGDGLIDNCERPKKLCREYLAQGSDDVKDPAGDNYHRKKNKEGTEGDGKYQYIHLAGFGPFLPFGLQNRLATGIHDPIWSRAMAITDQNQNTVVLVSTDLPGLTWKYINPIRRRVAKEFNIPVSNLVLTSTHVHSAPDGSGYWAVAQPGKNRAYIKKMKEWIYQSIVQALEARQPARMKVITTQHDSCWDPHTKVVKKLPHCRINPFKYQNKKGKIAKGLIDQWIIQSDLRDPIVLNPNIVAAHFQDVQTHQPLGTFINWHNHPDSLGDKNMLISSEFAHYLRKYTEHYLGGISVYFSGTLGNQIGSTSGVPVPLWNEQMQKVYRDDELDINGNRVPEFVSDRSYDKIRSIGYEIGFEVVDAMRRSTDSWETNFAAKIQTQPIDVQIDNALHMIGTYPVWYRGVEKPDRLLRYSGHCHSGWGCVRTDLSVIELGSLSMVTSPGETDPAYFLGRSKSKANYQGLFGRHTYPAMPAIRDYMPGRHHAILGQANNYLSYLIPRSDNIGWWNIQHPNHYEEGVTVGKNFGDEVGNKLMAMLGSPVRFSERKFYPPLSASSMPGEQPLTGNSKQDHHPTKLVIQLLQSWAKSR